MKTTSLNSSPNREVGRGLPRGLRNNNPLNIRHSSSKWQGMSAVQTDRQFVQFRSLAYGFRAAFKTIHTYMTKYGLCCVKQIVSRWAPPEDHNNTAVYIMKVCETSHLEPEQMLHWSNESEMVYLVQAMAYVECGCLIEGHSIREGYRMAFND